MLSKWIVAFLGFSLFSTTNAGAYDCDPAKPENIRNNLNWAPGFVVKEGSFGTYETEYREGSFKLKDQEFALLTPREFKMICAEFDRYNTVIANWYEHAKLDLEEIIEMEGVPEAKKAQEMLEKIKGKDWNEVIGKEWHQEIDKILLPLKKKPSTGELRDRGVHEVFRVSGVQLVNTGGPTIEGARISETKKGKGGRLHDILENIRETAGNDKEREARVAYLNNLKLKKKIKSQEKEIESLKKAGTEVPKTFDGKK